MTVRPHFRHGKVVVVAHLFAFMPPGGYTTTIMTMLRAEKNRRRFLQEETEDEEACYNPLFVNTTLNDNPDSYRIAGMMFSMRLKDVPLNVTAIEIDIRDDFAQGRYGVDIYTRRGAFSTVYNDPDKWWPVAKTRAVPVPGGGGYLIPYTNFRQISMQAGELRSWFISVRGKWLDTRADAMSRPGDVADSFPPFDLTTGIGFAKYNFQEEIDKMISPQFTGVFHYDEPKQCEDKVTDTVMIGYQFLVDLDSNDQVLETISNHVHQVMESLLKRDEELKGFITEFELGQFGKPFSFFLREGEIPVCPEAFATCVGVGTTVKFKYDSDLDKGRLQYKLYIAANDVAAQLQKKLGVRLSYIGNRGVAAKFDITIEGTPVDEHMNARQRAYFEQSFQEFLARRMQDEELLSVRIIKQETQDRRHLQDSFGFSLPETIGGDDGVTGVTLPESGGDDSSGTSAEVDTTGITLPEENSASGESSFGTGGGDTTGVTLPEENTSGGDSSFGISEGDDTIGVTLPEENNGGQGGSFGTSGEDDTTGVTLPNGDNTGGDGSFGTGGGNTTGAEENNANGDSSFGTSEGDATPPEESNTGGDSSLGTSEGDNENNNGGSESVQQQEEDDTGGTGGGGSSATTGGGGSGSGATSDPVQLGAIRLEGQILGAQPAYLSDENFASVLRSALQNEGDAFLERLTFDLLRPNKRIGKAHTPFFLGMHAIDLNQNDGFIAMDQEEALTPLTEPPTAPPGGGEIDNDVRGKISDVGSEIKESDGLLWGVIGCLVAALVVLLIAFCWCRRRNRKRMERLPEETAPIRGNGPAQHVQKSLRTLLAQPQPRNGGVLPYGGVLGNGEWAPYQSQPHAPQPRPYQEFQDDTSARSEDPLEQHPQAQPHKNDPRYYPQEQLYGEYSDDVMVPSRATYQHQPHYYSRAPEPDIEMQEQNIPEPRAKSRPSRWRSPVIQEPTPIQQFSEEDEEDSSEEDYSKGEVPNVHDHSGDPEHVANIVGTAQDDTEGEHKEAKSEFFEVWSVQDVDDNLGASLPSIPDLDLDAASISTDAFSIEQHEANIQSIQEQVRNLPQDTPEHEETSEPSTRASFEVWSVNSMNYSGNSLAVSEADLGEGDADESLPSDHSALNDSSSEEPYERSDTGEDDSSSEEPYERSDTYDYSSSTE